MAHSQTPNKNGNETSPRSGVCSHTTSLCAKKERLGSCENTHGSEFLASFPGLLTPAFVACSTNVLVQQAANAGVRRPGNEATEFSM